MRCLSYDERLQKLGLPRLELRRLHLDLIFGYKIVFGLVCVNFNDFLVFSPTLTTRGHAYKLFKPRCTSGVRQNFYTERVINLWNSLPPTVSFTSLTSFRRTICSVDFSRFFVSSVVMLFMSECQRLNDLFVQLCSFVFWWDIGNF